MPTPIAHLDFVNGVYTYNGSPITAAQVVDLPGRISASGLSIINGSPVQLLNQSLALLLTLDWSAVVEYQANAIAPGSGAVRAFLFTLTDGPSFNSQVACYTQAFVPAENACDSVFFEDNGAGITRVVFSDDIDINAFGPVPGTNRCGYTRTNAFGAVCINGFVPVRNNTVITPGSYGFALTQVQLADATDVSVGGFVRKLDIYAPLSDSDLATLTGAGTTPTPVPCRIMMC